MKETVEGMLSADYKERFKAKLKQLTLRKFKLAGFVSNYDNLDFKPHCSKELLERQIQAMHEYENILLERARIEGIDIV